VTLGGKLGWYWREATLIVVIAGRSVRNAIASIEGRREDMSTAGGC